MKQQLKCTPFSWILERECVLHTEHIVKWDAQTIYTFLRKIQVCGYSTKRDIWKYWRSRHVIVTWSFSCKVVEHFCFTFAVLHQTFMHQNISQVASLCAILCTCNVYFFTTYKMLSGQCLPFILWKFMVSLSLPAYLGLLFHKKFGISNT